MATPLLEVARFQRLTPQQYERLTEFLEDWRKETEQQIATLPAGSFALGRAQIGSWLSLVGNVARLESPFEGIHGPSAQNAVQWLDAQTRMEIHHALERYVDEIKGAVLYGLRGQVNPTQVASWLYHATHDGEQNWRMIARTELNRANAEGRLQTCLDQGYDKVWAPPHVGACKQCKTILENQIFTIAEVQGVTNFNKRKGEGLKPCIPLHPNCRHVWLPYIPHIYEYQQENVRRLDEMGLTDERINEMFDSGGELKPEYANAVDWSAFKALNPYEWSVADAVERSLDDVRKGYFDNPQADLDPLVFARGRLRNGVRQRILDWWQASFGTPSWARLYLTGSETGRQWLSHPERDPDLDVQVLVDVGALRAERPEYAALSQADLHAALLAILRASLTDVEAAPGLRLEAFLRPEVSITDFAHDVALTGQSVYDVHGDRWFYRARGEAPTELYGMPLLEGIGARVAAEHPDWLAGARLKAEHMNELLARHDAGEPVLPALVESYDDVHRSRRRSFEPDGGGQSGHGNFTWQYLWNYGPLLRLKQLATRPTLKGPYVIELDVAKAAPEGFQVGVEHWITVHPNGPDTDGHPVLVRNTASGSMMVIGGAGGHLNGVQLDPKRRTEGKGEGKGSDLGTVEQPISEAEEAQARAEYEENARKAQQDIDRIRTEQEAFKERIGAFLDEHSPIQLGGEAKSFAELSPKDQVIAQKIAFASARSILTDEKLDREALSDTINLSKLAPKAEPEPERDVPPDTDPTLGEPPPEVADPQAPLDTPPKAAPPIPRLAISEDVASALEQMRVERAHLSKALRQANKVLTGDATHEGAFTMDWKMGVAEEAAANVEQEIRTNLWRQIGQQVDDANGSKRLVKAQTTGGLDALNDVAYAVNLGENIPYATQQLLGITGTTQLMAYRLQQKARAGELDLPKLVEQLDQIRDERERRVVDLGSIRARKAADMAAAAIQERKEAKETGASLYTSTCMESQIKTGLENAAAALGSAVSGYEAIGGLRLALDRDASKLRIGGFSRASQIHGLAAKAGVSITAKDIVKTPGGYSLQIDAKRFEGLMHPTHEVPQTDLGAQLAKIRNPVELRGAIEKARTNTPGYTGPKLMERQAAGKMWLQATKRGVLAFAPGVGKTKTALCAALDVMSQNPGHKCLIVAPTNALTSVWAKEINDNTEAGKFTTRVIGKKGLTDAEGGTNPQKQLAGEGTDFTIIGFEMLRSNPELVRKLGCQVVIADEAQNARNPKTGLRRMLESATGDSEYRWALTGSPVHKSLNDLHSVYTWARGVDSLGSQKQFADRWARVGKQEHATGEEQVAHFRESIQDGLFYQPSTTGAQMPTLNGEAHGQPQEHEVKLDESHLDAIRTKVAGYNQQYEDIKQRRAVDPTYKGKPPAFGGMEMINEATYKHKGSNAIAREVVRMAMEHPGQDYQGKHYAGKTIVFDHQVQTLQPVIEEAKRAGVPVVFTHGEMKDNDDRLRKFLDETGPCILVTSDKNKAAVNLQFGYSDGKFQHGATQTIHLRPPLSNGDREQRVARMHRKGAVAACTEHTMVPTDQKGRRLPFAQAALTRLDNERRLAGLVGGPEGEKGESVPLRQRLKAA